MKNENVLPIQLSVLKTIVKNDDFQNACFLLTQNIDWHNDTQEVIKFLKETVQKGDRTFAYILSQERGENWVKGLDNAFIYHNREELKKATDVLINQTKKYSFVEKLEKVVNSKTPIETFESLHQDLLSNLSGKNLTYKSSDLIGELHKNRKKELDSNNLLGLPSGFPEIDKATYGLQLGQFWVLGAATSAGKTWIALQILLDALNYKNNNKGLYFSLELSAQEIFTRVVANQSGSSLKQIKLDKSDFISQKIDDTCKTLEQKEHLYINDNCYFLHQIVALIYQHIAMGVKYFVIDYIQNILPDGIESEYEKLSKVVVTLQSIAREKNVFILALTQFNRESVKQVKKVADMFQSKGSGNIENAADILLKIDVDEADRTQTDLKIVKNRIMGELATQSLKGDFDIARYKPVYHDEQLTMDKIAEYIGK